MLRHHHGKIHLKRRDFLKTTAIASFAATIPGISAFARNRVDEDKWYEMLADSLNKLPNSFPRTNSNIEILLLKKIFLPEEARLAGQLTGKFESISSIALKFGLDNEETKKRLTVMESKGFVWSDGSTGSYRLAPFIVGIYEAQLARMDHDMAHLVEEYFHQGGSNIMRPLPSIHRVIPAQSAVKSEWILPYDKLREILLSCNTFRVNNCICRTEQDLVGTRKCKFPLDVELIFYRGPETSEPPVKPYITKEEALNILDNVEKIGLVHTVRNVANGIFYVCNCCGCCCGILRGINEFGIEHSVAAANYYSVIDPDKCQACGTCIERCQMHAITAGPADIAIVDRKICIGCGLCATGCPANVAHLELKPAEDRIEPPDNYGDWEHQRLVNRGLV